MPRDIPVGNGSFLICFDRNYRIRDIYFPHIGQENHVGGNPCRFGVWVGGTFSWATAADGWKQDTLYEEDTLVTRVSLYHRELKVLLTCSDTVDFHENVFLRRFVIENLASERREFRLFLHHSFNISGNSVGDTAAFDPDTGGVVHYKANRYFLANGIGGDPEGLYQFATGQKGVNGREGTWRDAEDGKLSGNPIAQGSVDSVISLRLAIDAVSTGEAFYWITAGKDWEAVRRLDARVRRKGPQTLIRRTADYWRLWVHKETPSLELFPAKTAELYRKSLLVLRTQIDWKGGILAANDSDVISYNRDTYSYIWPRDGALVANALDLAGYPVLAENFYHFAADIIKDEGYFLHKYNPDGSLASSWHPWFMDGEVQLPIQEDETALVIWALWNHFVLYRDIESIKPLYRHLIKRAADFMCGYRDPATGLPGNSYDLWEERRGIPSFTTGAVFGGLTAASLFCAVFGETGLSERYRSTAAEIRDAASTFLWSEKDGRFRRMITVSSDGGIEYDATCDASLWGLFAFGMYSVEDPRIMATMDALKQRLWLKTPVGGMARYEDDDYYRDSGDIPGNPWFISTLWYADYLMERAKTREEIAEAMDILSWVADHAMPSGVLAEQVHPETGEPLSVSPLTWSHATFVSCCQHIMRRLQRLETCPECGLPKILQRGQEDWIERLYDQTCDAIRGICRIK